MPYKDPKNKLIWNLQHPERGRKYRETYRLRHPLSEAVILDRARKREERSQRLAVLLEERRKKQEERKAWLRSPEHLDELKQRRSERRKKWLDRRLELDPDYFKKNYSRNREERLQKQREYRERNKSQVAILNFKHNLKCKYGVSVDDYNVILSDQNWKCAICRKKFKSQNVYVNSPTLAKGIKPDHCHNAGHLRGLLCHGCNAGIGFFRNSAHITLKASQYLSREILFNGHESLDLLAGSSNGQTPSHNQEAHIES